MGVGGGGGGGGGDGGDGPPPAGLIHKSLVPWTVVGVIVWPSLGIQVGDDESHSSCAPH